MIISSARKTFSNKISRYHTNAFHHNNQFLDLINLLQLSIAHKSLNLARQSHAQIITLNLTQNPFVATKLITSYSSFKTLTHAQLVFDSVRDQNVYLWNSLINGYVKNRCFVDAFRLFNQMCMGSISVFPDDFTLSMLSKVCGELGDMKVGDSVHGKCIRIGFVWDTIVANSLMFMYHKCDEFKKSLKLFDEMPVRNSGSWNVIISGYAGSNDVRFDESVCKLIGDMQIEGVKPDVFTISTVLTLCGDHKGKCDYGRELHCYVVKNGYEFNSCSGSGLDPHLGSSLIDMYSKSNRIDLSKLVFDKMMHRNVFVWTSMINGYVSNGNSEKALILFQEMQVDDQIKPNKVSLVSILPACSNSFTGLAGGKQIHGFALRNGLSHDIALCNALIDMYSKCGNLSYAEYTFEDDSLCKDAISWTSMINGYGLHGKGREAVSLYNEMCLIGIKPDMITIVGVLCACGKAGLVNEGLAVYKRVIDDYQIEPTLEICACVVDILGRSGRLDEALGFIKEMPVEPGPSVWGALISGSIIHGNTKMQDLAYRFLIQLEPDNPSNYISLSNVYASSKKWDGVAQVRTTMKERKLRKVPGCSWISINTKTHCFVVADKAHPCSILIYEILKDLTSIMKGDDELSPDLGKYVIDQPV